MAKYNIKTKKKLIELIERKHNSIAKRWLKMYRAHGYEGLVMKSKIYAGAFKVHARIYA